MKKRYSFLLILLIVALLIYVVKDINFLELYALFKKINLFYLGLAFLTCFWGFLLWNFRLRYVLKSLTEVNYWFLFKVLLAGTFVSVITPGAKFGGEPIKAYFLSKEYKKPKSRFLGSIFADKSLNLIVFFMFLIFSIMFVLVFVNIPQNLKLILEGTLIFIFLLIAVIVCLAYRKARIDPKQFLRKFYRIKKIKKHFKNVKEFDNYTHTRVRNFVNAFKKVFVSKRKFWFSISISLAYWMTVYLVSYFLFLAFGFKINFLFVIIVVTLGHLIGDVSPIPGGIGLMEGTMFLLYFALGVELELAAIVALLSRMIFYFYSLFIGGILLIYLKIRLSRKVYLRK